MNVLKNYINGAFISSESTQFFEFMNPALDEPLGKIPMSTKEEVYRAVEAAKSAFLPFEEFSFLISYLFVIITFYQLQEYSIKLE